MSEQPEPIILPRPTDLQWLSEYHVEDANFLHGITAYGHVDPDGSQETKSIKCSYFEPAEKLEMENLKTVKFWLYRNDAIAFAEAIIKVAKSTNSNGSCVSV